MTWASMPCSLDGTSSQLPRSKAPLLDHPVDVGVGRSAGIDAVDLALELVGEAAEIGEAADAAFRHVVRHGQRELGVLQVGPDQVGFLVLQQRLRQMALRRHPVAEEDVDLAGLQALEGDRHRHRFDLLLIAQRLQQQAGDGVGRRDVGPARVGHAHRLARFGIGRLRGRA